MQSWNSWRFSWIELFVVELELYRRFSVWEWVRGCLVFWVCDCGLLWVLAYLGCVETSLSLLSSSPRAGPYLAKRRTANHPCPVCGKHYVNEGSLRKHLACHPETSQLTTSLRMWPCSVCQAVFTHESGTISLSLLFYLHPNTKTPTSTTTSFLSLFSLHSNSTTNCYFTIRMG